jgi:hypothetical protein
MLSPVFRRETRHGHGGEVQLDVAAAERTWRIPASPPRRSDAFMLTYNTRMAYPFECKKSVRFYKRLKDKIAARAALQLAA